MEIRPFSVWRVDGASLTDILLRGTEETSVHVEQLGSHWTDFHEN